MKEWNQNHPTCDERPPDCAQYIPSGQFPEDFDTSDREAMLNLLRDDKHQLLEGLVIENVAEQFIRKLSADARLSVLDVVTLITRGHPAGGADQYCTFLWIREENSVDDLISIFRNMQNGCEHTTFICRQDNFRFYVTKPDQREWKLLQSYLCNRRRVDPRGIPFPRIADNVRDHQRQNSTIMGRLDPAFRERLIPDVVMPRIFKNYMIQPFFRYGWDLDRLFRYRNELWEFELKHKYPIKNYDYFSENNIVDNQWCLSFGINEGQAHLINMLAAQGLKTLHLILVKPRWSDQEDPGYLFVDETAREKTLVVGAVLDKARTDYILNGKRKESPEKTSYTGEGGLHYYRIPRTFFHVIGCYAEGSEKLAPKIRELLDGSLDNPLTPEILLANRI